MSSKILKLAAQRNQATRTGSKKVLVRLDGNGRISCEIPQHWTAKDIKRWKKQHAANIDRFTQQLNLFYNTQTI